MELQEQPVETPVEDLGAIYDQINEAPTENVETVEVDPVQEPAPEPVAAPGEVPEAVKAHWNDIPEAARDAIAASQKEMALKLSENGRLMTGLKPFQDAMVRAAREMPHLANMKPADIADNIFELARVSHKFNTDPVGALMGLIKQHGMEAKVAQALGQPIADVDQKFADIQRENAALRERLDKIPGDLDGTVEQILAQRETAAAVNEFASNAEHWAAVEDKLPVTIQLVQAKLGESASVQDVLTQAYDLAVSQFVPNAVKAQEKAAAEAAQPDPEKAEAARKAKSVNVQSAPTKERTLSEDDLLGRTWDRMQE